MNCGSTVCIFATILFIGILGQSLAAPQEESGLNKILSSGLLVGDWCIGGDLGPLLVNGTEEILTDMMKRIDELISINCYLRYMAVIIESDAFILPEGGNMKPNLNQITLADWKCNAAKFSTDIDQAVELYTIFSYCGTREVATKWGTAYGNQIRIPIELNGANVILARGVQCPSHKNGSSGEEQQQQQRYSLRLFPRMSMHALDNMYITTTQFVYLNEDVILSIDREQAMIGRGTPYISQCKLILCTEAYEISTNKSVMIRNNCALNSQWRLTISSSGITSSVAQLQFTPKSLNMPKCHILAFECTLYPSCAIRSAKKCDDVSCDPNGTNIPIDSYPITLESNTIVVINAYRNYDDPSLANGATGMSLTRFRQCDHYMTADHARSAEAAHSVISISLRPMLAGCIIAGASFIGGSLVMVLALVAFRSVSRPPCLSRESSTGTDETLILATGGQRPTLQIKTTDDHNLPDVPNELLVNPV